MWEPGKQKVYKHKDFNEEIKNIQGNLSEEKARYHLSKFLRYNVGFTWEYFSSQKLFPMQEIVLKAMFLGDIGAIIATRGGAKSMLISVFSILYPIFYPGNAVCLISANFRGSRRVLENAEKMVQGEGAELMNQCFPNPLKRANDQYRWIIPNGSEIFALPLTEQIRGARAQALLVDEGLLVNQEIQNTIIRPFLAARSNIRQEMEIREIEDGLIRDGVMTEEDRVQLSKNKYITLSSASYDFEFLADMYKSYNDIILDPNKLNISQKDVIPRYFTIRYGYKAIEEMPGNGWLDMTQIRAAAADGGDQTAAFKREYDAEFTKSGDGYFNVRKMYDCCIPFGDEPTVQLKGLPDSQYILAIDPSYSASKSSDFFAMAIYLLIPQEKKIILVHTYGKAGGQVKDHYLYLSYLLKYFNPVFIAIDNTGSEFIHNFNESVVAKNNNLKLQFFDDVNLEKTQLDEYQQEIEKLKNQHNMLNGKIVWGQPFSSQSIRTMNERLQAGIDAKKVWFGSRMEADEQNAKKYKDILPKFEMKNKNDQAFGIIDFIDDQNNWIPETIAQTALVEVKTTALGTQTFDLPSNLRKSTDPSRPRKDHYTCLLMGYTAAYHYFNMSKVSPKKEFEGFSPMVLR